MLPLATRTAVGRVSPLPVDHQQEPPENHHHVRDLRISDGAAHGSEDDQTEAEEHEAEADRNERPHVDESNANPSRLAALFPPNESPVHLIALFPPSRAPGIG